MNKTVDKGKGNLIFETKLPLWTILWAFSFGSLLIFLSLLEFPDHRQDPVVRVMLGVAGFYHLLLAGYVLLFRRSANPYRIYEFGIEFPKRFRKKSRKFVWYQSIEKIYRKRSLLTLRINDGTEYPIDRLRYENILLPHLKKAIGEEQWSLLLADGTF